MCECSCCVSVFLTTNGGGSSMVVTSSGANVNIHGMTPDHTSVSKVESIFGEELVFKELLEAGANMEVEG